MSFLIYKNINKKKNDKNKSENDKNYNIIYLLFITKIYQLYSLLYKNYNKKKEKNENKKNKYIAYLLFLTKI